VRWCAVKALECLWAPENAAALKMAAGDENPMVRIAAAEALALKAPDKAKDVLGRAAKSTHSGERESALFYART
jgi:HEAT repeat protein